MKTFVFACAGVLFALVGTLADAASIRISYTFGTGDVFTARLDGSFRPAPDAGIFDVSALGGAAMNGTPFPSEFNTLAASEAATPVVSLDGSVVDIFLRKPVADGQGVQLTRFGNFSVANFILPEGIASETLSFESFLSDRWSAEVVPLPAPAFLLLGGMGALLLLRRRSA